MIRNLGFILLFFIANGLCAQNRYDKSWSYTLEIGANKFDGDFNQNYNDLIPTSFLSYTIGASAERSLTPIWGVGGEFYYLPVGATATGRNFEAKLIHINPYVSANILNLFEQRVRKWGIWATAGAGFAYYNSTLYKNGTQFDEIKNGLAITIAVGGLVEYSINKSLALGGRVQYRSHNKDNLEGSNKTAVDGGYNYKGVTNDYLAMATVFVRWKFKAQKLDHIRNQSTGSKLNDALSMAQLALERASIAEIMAYRAQKELDSVKLCMDTLKTMLADGPDTDCDGVPNTRDKEPRTPHGNKVDFFGRTLLCAEQRIVPVSTPVIIAPKPKFDLLSNGADSDNDGVPDDRDKEPDTPPNTAVDFWGRTVKQEDTNGFGSVYFDFDKSDINAEGRNTIKLVAYQMTVDRTLRVEIRGYCDNAGSMAYNLKLSQQRANKVKTELVKLFKINANRIVVNGKGKLVGDQSEAHLNRRCNFFFDK